MASWVWSTWQGARGLFLTAWAATLDFVISFPHESKSAFGKADSLKFCLCMWNKLTSYYFLLKNTARRAHAPCCSACNTTSTGRLLQHLSLDLAVTLFLQSRGFKVYKFRSFQPPLGLRLAFHNEFARSMTCSSKLHQTTQNVLG